LGYSFWSEQILSEKKSEAVMALERVEENIEFHLKRFEMCANPNNTDYGIYLGLSLAYQFIIREINEQMDKE